MKCSKCNHEYEDGLPVCPLCGEPAPVSDSDDKEEVIVETVQTLPPPKTEERFSGGFTSPSSPPPAYSAPRSPQASTPPEPVEGSGAAPLVLGILSLLIPFVGLVLAIIAIVMGNNQRKAALRGTAAQGFGQAGWVLGIVGLCFQAFLIIYIIAVAGFVVSILGRAISEISSYSNYPGYDYYSWY